MIKIRYSFNRVTDSNLEKQAASILQNMDGNANFPTPTPTMVVLSDAIDAYATALVNAEDRSRLAVAQKRAARALLEGLLSQLAMYVLQVSNGNEVLMVSSGYQLTKVREPRIIANPGSVSLANGRSSGELRASVKAVPGARSYIHSISSEVTGTEDAWVSTTSSRRSIEFNGLQQGVRYHVRTSAVGSDGQVTQSPVSSIYVQ